jgi:hypothetical protein
VGGFTPTFNLFLHWVRRRKWTRAQVIDEELDERLIRIKKQPSGMQTSTGSGGAVATGADGEDGLDAPGAVDNDVQAQWIDNDEVESCMCCLTKRFTVFARKHHCRRCGRYQHPSSLLWSLPTSLFLVVVGTSIPLPCGSLG